MYDCCSSFIRGLDMKKALKIIGIIFGLMFALGIIAIALETPEQKAEREAKMAQDMAKSEAEKARLKAEEKLKEAELQVQKQAEPEDEAKKEAEEKATTNVDTLSAKLPQTSTDKQSPTVQANFGITPQELGGAIDKKVKATLGANTTLAKVQITGNHFMFDVGEGVFWTGNVDKQGMASASSYRMTVKQGDDKEKITAMLMLVGFTAQVLHPDVDKEQIGKIAEMASQATTKALQTNDAVNDSILIGDIKHYVEVYPTTGNIVIGAYHKDQ